VGAGNAGVAQLVERKLPKLEVAGSNPVARSIFSILLFLLCLPGKKPKTGGYLR